MKPRFPITREKIKNHFAYAWWQYALLIGLAIFGWNLLYTTTHYRSPENLKVEWYYGGFQAQAERDVEELVEELHQSLLSDMEEVVFLPIALDDAYGVMQLTVWASAGQGDLFMLNQEYFQMLAQSGALVDLTPYLENGAIHGEGLDLANGQAIDGETGKRVQVGIPAEGLKKLGAYGLSTEGYVLGVAVNCGNVENALKLLGWLTENMR